VRTAAVQQEEEKHDADPYSSQHLGATYGTHFGFERRIYGKPEFTATQLP